MLGRRLRSQFVCLDIVTSRMEVGVGFGKAVSCRRSHDQELHSGLPKGFDPSSWAQDPKINGGPPYLIDNPPDK